jgi:hypothetical protein
MASKSTYTNLKERSSAYKRIMDEVGRCMKQGGYVDFYHFVESTQNVNGHIIRTNYANVTLNWP